MFQHFGYFDYWNPSVSALLDAGNISNLPLDDLIVEWKRNGCFMHSVNHPKLAVTASIVEQMLSRDGFEVCVPHTEKFVIDHLQRQAIWPVYPDIAERLGLKKETVLFKNAHREDDSFDVYGLEGFIQKSFEVYRLLPREGFVCNRDLTQFLALFDSRPLPATRRVMASNPYSGLSAEHFWKPSVAQLSKQDVDPVLDRCPKSSLATRLLRPEAVSLNIFQRISSQLDFDFLDVEPAPSGVLPGAAAQWGYGLFSARYGNVYTARQLVQLLERATGSFNPKSPPGDAGIGVMPTLSDPKSSPKDSQRKSRSKRIERATWRV